MIYEPLHTIPTLTIPEQKIFAMLSVGMEIKPVKTVRINREKDAILRKLASYGLCKVNRRAGGWNYYGLTSYGRLFATKHWTATEAQTLRQKMRNADGTYAEMNECEECGKRKAEVYYDDDTNMVVCTDCLAKREAVQS